MVRRGTAVCFWLQKSVTLLWWEGWLRDQALRIDSDESTVLFLVRMGTVCLAFCKSIYHAFSVSIAQVKTDGNILKKKRKIYLYMIVNNLAVVRSGVISSCMNTSLSENYIFFIQLFHVDHQKISEQWLCGLFCGISDLTISLWFAFILKASCEKTIK